MRASPSSLQKPDSLDRLSEGTGSCRRDHYRRKLARRGCRLRIGLSLNEVYALGGGVSVYFACVLRRGAAGSGCVRATAHVVTVWRAVRCAVRQCVSRSLFIEGRVCVCCVVLRIVIRVSRSVCGLIDDVECRDVSDPCVARRHVPRRVARVARRTRRRRASRAIPIECDPELSARPI